MLYPLYFDDVELDDSWLSPSRTVSEQDVLGFAELTGDFNRLHVDAAFAAGSPFKGQIAHGILGLALVAGLGSESPLMHTLAFTQIGEWKFLRPIYFGDTVHVCTTVIEKDANHRRRGRIKWRRQLINQAGEIVQEGVFETLVSREAGAVQPAEEAATPQENGAMAKPR